MKQALNRLALYCAAQCVTISAGREGFAIRPRGMAEHTAHTISVDELADRVEAMNSAPMAAAVDHEAGRQAKAATRALVAMGYEWDGFVGYWAPPRQQDVPAATQMPAPVAKVLAAAGYDSLADVLHRAFHQAASGKGKERHAKGQPFHEQVMQVGAQHFGTGSLLFQAFKKAEESQRLPHERGVAELLGAIVYLAGAVVAEERKHADRNQAANDPTATAQRHA